VQFQIETMTCGGCARGVAKAVQSVDPDALVTPDVPGRRIAVTSTKSRSEIEAALAKAGYPAVPLDATTRQEA
jgi:copper chaperone